MKQIAVIVPSSESLELYNTHLFGYKNFLFKHYLSFDEFNRDMSKHGGCDGFVIDWRVILRSEPQEKEYFKYLMKLFPSIRISHSLDKKEISGDFRGRMLKDRQLFDYFFCEVFPGSKEKYNKEIILIVENSESRSLYESYLRIYPNVTFRSYTSVKEFTSVVTKDNIFSGFIIDLRTIMKENPEDRAVLHELIEYFPAIRISRVAGRKEIKGVISDKNLHDRELFDHFIKDLCAHFIPRGIRMEKRRTAFFSVSLDLSEGRRFKTNTLDVTDKGCFISGVLDVQKGDRLHIVIHELTDRSYIECRVIWVLPWGENIKHPAGFGVLFTQIKPQQREELISLIGKKI